LTKNQANDFVAEVFNKYQKPLLSRLDITNSTIRGFGAKLLKSYKLPVSMQLGSTNDIASQNFSGAVFHNNGIAVAKTSKKDRIVITLNKVEVPKEHVWTGTIRTENRSKSVVSEVAVIGSMFRPVNTEFAIKVTCPRKDRA